MLNCRCKSLCAVFFELLMISMTGFTHADTLTTPDAVAQFSRQKYDAIASLKVLAASTSRATAQIEFRRPGEIRINGVDTSGSKYALVAKSGTTWVNFLGTWSKQKDAEMGIAGLTGVTLSTATTLPALLLHTQWGYPYVNNLFVSSVVHETVNGHATYRIEITVGGDADTYWIDTRTGLVVKQNQKLGAHSDTTITYTYQSINDPISDSVFALPR